jgi:hypothetical protein
MKAELPKMRLCIPMSEKEHILFNHRYFNNFQHGPGNPCPFPAIKVGSSEGGEKGSEGVPR